MSTRAEIEAILPAAGEAVVQETGVHATGFGITGKAGGLALAVTLPEPPHRKPPETLLGVDVVFTVVERPVFLGKAKKRHQAA